MNLLKIYVGFNSIIYILFATALAITINDYDSYVPNKGTLLNYKITLVVFIILAIVGVFATIKKDN